MAERDAFEEWWAEEVKAAGNLSLTTQQVYLLEQCFRAGARSRDAEVEGLREALREWLATPDGCCLYAYMGTEDEIEVPCGRCAVCRARAALGEDDHA